MINKKDVFVVLPAFNEEKRIENIILKLKNKGYKNIIVVDDCSNDKTNQIAKSKNIIVLKHEINRGAGAATKTGLDAALLLKAKYAVTIDSDGQHDPEDIENLLKFAEKYDVVIGSRMIKPKGMPISRIFYNKIGSLVTFLLYGIYVKDSQSGFKVFNKKALEKIKINFDRYEFCSEIIHEIKINNLKYKEVPIKVIYTKYSLSKGQSFINGLKMVYKMIMRLFL